MRDVVDRRHRETSSSTASDPKTAVSSKKQDTFPPRPKREDVPEADRPVPAAKEYDMTSSPPDPSRDEQAMTTTETESTLPSRSPDHHFRTSDAEEHIARDASDPGQKQESLSSTAEPVTEPIDSVPATPSAAGGDLQRAPLERAGWPVERVEPTAPTAPGREDVAPDEAPSSPDIGSRERMKNEAVEKAVEQVAPGHPTSAAVEFIPPRRRREKRSFPSRTPTEPKSDKPPETNPESTSATMSDRPAQVVTEIGDLPADLWRLIGQEPPAAAPTQEDKGEQNPIEVVDSTEQSPATKSEPDTPEVAVKESETPDQTLTVSKRPGDDNRIQASPSQAPSDIPAQPQEQDASSVSAAEKTTERSGEKRTKRNLDTDQIAHLVLEDILQRHAIEIERLLR
jgi:hypothetical protein